MITFERDGHCFNYRVAGVALVGGRVLLHRGEADAFWTCPGGRVELGESAEQALRREMREELAVEIGDCRLLWFVENFFVYHGAPVHEIALYYLMDLPVTFPGWSADEFEATDAGVRLIFRWFPVDAGALAALPLLPSFLQEALCDLPPAVQHVVHTDVQNPRMA